MLLPLLATTVAQKRHLQEIGLVVAIVGAGVVILAGFFGLRSFSRLTERSTLILGGLLLAIGFVIQLLSIHSGSGR